MNKNYLVSITLSITALSCASDIGKNDQSAAENLFTRITNDRSIINEIELTDKVEGNINKFEDSTHISPTKIVELNKSTIQLYSLALSLNSSFQKLTLVDDDNNREEFYYDRFSNTLVYSYKLGAGEISRTIILGNRHVISYIKENNRVKFNKIDSFTAETKISEILFKFDSYIHFFENNHVIDTKPTINSIPFLVTATKIELKEKPEIDSKTLASIPKDVALFYLGCSERIDTVKGKCWVWYKVADTTKKHIGWAFGHPTFIHEMNDY